MFETLETERLLVRRFAPADWEAVYAYTRDPQVMKYIPEGVFTPEMARDLVGRNAGPEAKCFPVILKAENRLIGDISFHRWFADHTYEIGWIFHRDYQNRGYATEAARAVMDYGFGTMGLQRIIATCQPENPPSYRVMEKLGMRREGCFIQCIRRPEGWWDEYFYAILAEEWSKQR